MNDDSMRPELLEQELKGLKDLLSVAQIVVSSLDLDQVLLDRAHLTHSATGSNAAWIARARSLFSSSTMIQAVWTPSMQPQSAFVRKCDPVARKIFTARAHASVSGS